MERAVVCIVNDSAEAERAIGQLRAAGFASDSISLLAPDKLKSRDSAHESKVRAPDIAATGASAGGVLGGALGWLVGVGSFAIPGIGPVLAASPRLVALSGAAVGAAMGGLTGALVGRVTPEAETSSHDRKGDGRPAIRSMSCRGLPESDSDEQPS